jgi:hypothetical protein
MSMADDNDSAERCTPLERVSNTDQNLQRGQIDGRLILGAFVVIVLAGPLATAAVDIQSSLATTPAFTWFSATVIALLIVATIVAAALGTE